jgi:hypothetical protein
MSSGAQVGGRGPAAPSREGLVGAFRAQAETCRQMGSAVYAELLGRAAADLAAGGVFADVVADYRGNPVLDALPFRVFGAVHAMALSGSAPELAAYYPSAGGRFDAEPAWKAVCALLAANPGPMRAAALEWRVQTNEVRRSAVLLGGFLRAARETRLPLRLREIGASAGLNLVWDRYRYALGPHRWGSETAELALSTDWTGPAPDLDAPVRVAERRGCDVAPIDAADPEQRLRLESFVWPDQLERLARLRAAVDAVLRARPPIDKEPAGSWVAREAMPQPGVATVLFHSVMWWYLPEEERAGIGETMEAAGARASAEAPLAWLRMEGASLAETELRLRLWPGGGDQLLARAHYHGASVRWLG